VGPQSQSSGYAGPSNAEGQRNTAGGRIVTDPEKNEGNASASPSGHPGEAAVDDRGSRYSTGETRVQKICVNNNSKL
jgi:hypothetical protein